MHAQRRRQYARVPWLNWWARLRRVIKQSTPCWARCTTRWLPFHPGASNICGRGRPSVVPRFSFLLSPEQKNDFDHENDHHHQLENEAARRAKFIHHELIQLASGTLFLIHQMPVVVYTDLD